MKSPEERGPIGAWAYRARAEAGLSVEEVAARLAVLGETVHPATIRGVEGGTKKPGARLLRQLAVVLGSEPPGAPPPAPPAGSSRPGRRARRTAARPMRTWTACSASRRVGR